MPTLTLAAMKASATGCGSGRSPTASGPPTPCQGSAPRHWSSLFLKIGQHVRIAPTRIAELAPVVVILGLAAVEQAVDRARSAQHFPARLLDPAIVEARLRLGLEHPVDALIEHGAPVAARDVDP